MGFCNIPGCDGALIPFLSSFPHQLTGTAFGTQANPTSQRPGIGIPKPWDPQSVRTGHPEKVSKTWGAEGSLGRVHWALKITKSSEKGSLCFQHTEVSFQYQIKNIHRNCKFQLSPGCLNPPVLCTHHTDQGLLLLPFPTKPA